MAAIITVLQNVVIPQWKDVAAGFWQKWNVPHCLGAIDGKHVVIQAPQASGSIYFNYRKTFSTVLMAAADSDYAFIFVDIGAVGSLGDSQVFQDCIFGGKMAENKLHLPQAEYLPNTETKMNYYFAGNGAFRLQTCLMKPFAARKLSLQEAVYNYRLSKGTRVVENAFGILVARWRIFKKPLCGNLKTIDQIVLAAVCFHNFIIRSRETEARDHYIPDRFVDTEEEDGSVQQGMWQNHVVGYSCAVVPARTCSSQSGKEPTQMCHPNARNSCHLFQ